MFWLLLHPDLEYKGIGILILFFTITLARSAQKLNGWISNTIELKHERENLLSKVSKMNADLQFANEQLVGISLTDSLTKINNRRYFDQRFPEEWRRCWRNSEPISCLLIDVDFFKQFNDNYGHQAGE